MSLTSVSFKNKKITPIKLLDIGGVSGQKALISERKDNHLWQMNSGGKFNKSPKEGKTQGV